MLQHSLPLTRPLVFLDVEATGKDPVVDHICELSLVKYLPSGFIDKWTRYFNPGVPNHPEAVGVHGLTDAFLSTFHPFQDYLPEILDFTAGCDLGGFNLLRFDIPILMEEMHRHGGPEWPAPDVKFVDAFVIFAKLNPRTLEAAVMHYLGTGLEGAHGAEADTLATGRVFEAQLQAHQELLGPAVDSWHQQSFGDTLVDYGTRLKRNPDGEIVYNFGKHLGVPVTKEKGYAQWMLSKDFPVHTKRKLREILNLK